MRPTHDRRWTVAAAALALIGAPLARGYCLTACSAAIAPAVAHVERSSSSVPCHESGEAPFGNPSSNPAMPGHGGCCDHSRIVQGAPPSLAESAHNPQVSAVAPYPAATGAELRREETYCRFASAAPALSRSLAVLRL